MRQHSWKLVAAALGLAAAPGARAQVFTPGNLVVSRSVYQGTASTVTIGQKLPGGGTATQNGAYPNVFGNDAVDASFGVTSPIFLDNVTTSGVVVGTFAVSPGLITTSFPSKSELAINFSTDGTALTFMGYQAPINQLDISNSVTPGAPDPNNPDTATPTYREIAQVGATGSVQITTTNAYSGNNGRAAILDSAHNDYLTVGNAANGGTPPPNGPVALGAGAQVVTPGQSPGAPTPAGIYSITQNGYAADKPSKDNNFRGETVFNNTLYVTKGSGGNGINTVYQVGNAGVLPTVGNAGPITILPGFSTALASSAGASHPFGLFFANASTLYVADEGNQSVTDTLANNTNAGLEKYSLSNGVWGLDYTLQNGLSLGVKYGVAGLDPSLDPATDGLRNITGKVNGDGTVTIFGVTSTVSASADQGADANEVVSITDTLAATALPTAEQFTTLEGPQYANVYRGVAFAPSAVPEPSAPALLLLPLAGLCLAAARRRRAA